MLTTYMLSALLTVPVAGIEWAGDYGAALERAQAEGRVLFLAIGMDEEARCEDLVRRVYKDREVIRLAESTVNLAAAPEAHRSGKAKCPRFSGILCEEHCRLDRRFREELLALNDKDVAAVPQHVWLDSAGAVLLSVPYEIEPEELVWCFVTAMRVADPAAAIGMPDGAYPPRRLVRGGLHAPGPTERRGRGLLEDELEEQIKKMRSSILGAGRIEPMLEILFTDEKDAVEYARVELGSGVAGWGDGSLLKRAIHTVGMQSPPSFWTVLAAYAKERSADLRNEAAVAFEQLGTPLALKTVKSSLGREKDDRVRKNWLRALGACARDDGGARSTLLAAVDEDDRVLRRNALLALGYLLPHADVRACLIQWLACGDPRDELAAACAMALTRDASYVPDLEAALAAGPDETHAADLKLAIDVLQGENLHVIQELVTRAGGDEIARERIFYR